MSAISYIWPCHLITMILHGVYKQWKRDCTFNSMFRLTTRKASKLRFTGNLWGQTTSYRWIILKRADSVSMPLRHHANLTWSVNRDEALFEVRPRNDHLAPPLLTLINFHPSMGKELRPLQSVEWNYFSIPKLQRCSRNHWSSEMDM